MWSSLIPVFTSGIAFAWYLIPAFCCCCFLWDGFFCLFCLFLESPLLYWASLPDVASINSPFFVRSRESGCTAAALLPHTAFPACQGRRQNRNPPIFTTTEASSAVTNHDKCLLYSLNSHQRKQRRKKEYREGRKNKKKWNRKGGGGMVTWVLALQSEKRVTHRSTQQKHNQRQKAC